MSEYKPPFHTMDKITNLVATISEQIGRIKVLSHGNLNPHLRKENRIRTIHSSLAIEHNFLSLEQVTAIVDGKHILGNPNEIREVKNAYDTYEMMLSLDLCSVKSKGESNLIADRPRKSTRMLTRLTADWVETLIINRLSRGEQVETMASFLPAYYR